METNAPNPLFWQADESLVKIRELLASKSGLRVVSFDFFDTLVSRLCADPADLFIEVGRQLAKRDMLLQPLSPAEFYSARIAADERARRNAAHAGRSSEVKLADIYQELKNVVRNPAQARDLEFDIERALIYVNPAMASLVQHVRELGYKTAILSDTYFTASELQRFLRENGMSPALFDAVIVSSERGKAKWNGHLYHDLFRHFDIHPSELLHIGDNQHADINSSRQFGAEAAHYYRLTPNLDLVFNGEKSLRGTNSYPAGSLDSLRVMIARQAESDSDAFRDGALTLGPLLTRYADWCVERFKASGVKTVLALMREGEVLGELVHRAAVAAGVELNVVPCFASRLATSRASMPAVTPENAADLLEGTNYVTARAVLDILGLRNEASKLLDAQTLQKPIPAGESLKGFLKILLALPTVRELVEKKRAESHELAFAYFSSLIGSETTVGVLDLGWSGSIQRNIARILRRGGREIRTIGCYVACTKRSGRLALDGDSVHAFMEANWASSTILAEVAINASIGSTNGYARNATGQVQPVLGPYATTDEERGVKQRIRDGIFAFQRAWLELLAAKGPGAFSSEMLADIDGNSAAILYRLLKFPTKPEADRLGALQHDENYFGENHSAPLCDEASARRLRREGVQPLFGAAKCYWPQGVVARSNPRLVSALRAGWEDPIVLGRLGAWHSLPLTDAGLTDEEVASLGTLANTLKFDQVIFVGPFSPILEELFLFLWQRNPSVDVGARPQFILAGTQGDRIPSQEFLKHATIVNGDPADLPVQQAIRKHLSPKGSAAVVFTSDFSGSTIKTMLLGLAPFLGNQGTVLAPVGRYDRHSLTRENAIVETMNDWYRHTGKELGYAIWKGAASAQPHLCNWVLFRRTPTATIWNNQWMLTGADAHSSAMQQPELLAGA